MFSGERSPKRQRLEGSYSPASPLPILDTKTFIPPHTPPPSERMSPSWTTQSLSAGQQQQAGIGGSGGNGSGTTFPTPPSTSGIHSHVAGHGGADSARQTPAGDDDVDMHGNDDRGRRDRDGDAEMTDLQAVDAEHRRTDHERQETSTGTGTSGDTVATSLLTASASTSTSAAAPPLPGANVLYRLRTARKYFLRARHAPALCMHC